MNNNTALTIRRNVTDNILDLVQKVAPIMHESRLFGVSSPAQAAAIILKGHELGLGFAASFEFIDVIQGKPTLSPRGALAILHGSPEIESIQTKQLVEKGAFVGYQCTMKRRGGFEYTASFTLEDAKRAGLVKKESAWERYPERMCLWRVIGFVADVVAPDIIGGMKRSDEFGADIDPNGNVIDGNWESHTPRPEENDDYDAILTGLIDEYTADAVVHANGGTIPTSPQELQAIAEKLRKGE